MRPEGHRLTVGCQHDWDMASTVVLFHLESVSGAMHLHLATAMGLVVNGV
jgi:hypothetical protein